MASDRDSGLQALQSGDTNAAVEHLERACQDDPNDYQAHLYLGAAYGDARRFMDAINILTKAVHLQPSNPQARYNLGIAMERGGYTDQATMAMEQALTLQPDYPKAKEALERLRPSATPAAPASAPATGDQFSRPIQSAPVYQAPNQASQSYPEPAQQPSYGQPVQSPSPGSQPGYNQPSGSTPPSQPPVSNAPLFGAPAASSSAAPYSPPGSYASAPAAQFGPPPSAQSPSAPIAPYGAPPQRPGPQTGYAPAPPPPAAGGTTGTILLGLVLGAVGGVLGTILWVGLVYLTKYQIGYAAIGIGILIGWMVKLGTRQPSPMGGVMAAVISFLSLGIGCMIIASMFQGVSLPFSFLFVVIGVAASYRFAAN